MRHFTSDAKGLVVLKAQPAGELSIEATHAGTPGVQDHANVHLAPGQHQHVDLTL